VKKRLNRAASQSQEHWAGIADAARQQAIANSWERATRAVTRRKTSSASVKLHPGWDAAFERTRAS
jgi:hypothetical protein